MLQIHTCSDLTQAAAAICTALRQTKAEHPFRDLPTIICPSKGIAHWLRRQIANEIGICAGMQFTYAHTFAKALVTSFLDETKHPAAPERDDAGRAMLQWFLYHRLGSVDADAVGHYLGTDAGSAIRRRQLAEALEERFAAYLVYRHDMVRGWEQDAENATHSPHEAWQRTLWREVCAHTDLRAYATSARQYQSMLASWAKATQHPRELPQRIYVLGVGYWPPLFLAMLDQASRHADILFYCLESVPVSDDDDRPFFLDQMTQQSRRQRSTLARLAPDRSAAMDAPSEAPPSTNLHTLQASLRQGTAAPVLSSGGDPSLQIHNCHAPLRELEVLRDAIFDYLQEDEAHHPRDILVVTPDMQAYAPLVHTVFDRSIKRFAPAYPVDEPLPYHIAEQTPVAEDSAAMALAYLLRLAEAPLSADAVMACFGFTALREAARIDEDELPQLFDWVRSLRIHVGTDADEPHSWQRGLQRLMMGYATGPIETLVGDIAPYAGDIAPDADLLGRFTRYVEMLFRQHEDLRRDRPLCEWGPTLRNLIDRLMVWDPQTERHDWSVLSPIQELEQAASLDAEAPVPFQAVQHTLLDALENQYHGRRFLAGGITFCGMQALRGVPFNMIAILGLNDGAFPRHAVPAAFDLMTVDAKETDPNATRDDRQTFLDLFMAARARLHLSYVGQSQKDNSLRPPSICLAELMEFLGVADSAEDPASKTLCKRHHLQPFDPAYYDNREEPSLPPTFDPTYADADITPRPFLSPGQPLPPYTPEDKEIALSDLIRFLVNPNEAFCRTRLDIMLAPDDPPLPNEEYLSTDTLQNYRIRTALAEAHAQPPQDTQEKLRARGMLPMDPLGQYCFDTILDETAPYQEAVRGLVFAPPRPLSLSVEGWTLHGTLANLTEDGTLAFCRPSSPSAKDYLHAWTWHLAATVARILPPDGAQTVIIGLDRNKGLQRFTLGPVANPAEFLADCVALYLDGLCRPLPLFANSSLAFIQTLRKVPKTKSPRSDNTERAMREARKAFEPEKSSHGPPRHVDWLDAYIRLCWRADNPFQQAATAAEFRRLASRVYDPLFDAMTTEDGS